MRKLGITLISFIIFFLFVGIAIAQETAENNLALFAALQRELAGDPSSWQTRDVPDIRVNPTQLFVPTATSPRGVMFIENTARTTTKPNAIDEMDTSSISLSQLLRRWYTFDSTSKIGGFIRDMGGNPYFDGQYILTTHATDDVGKIKDLFAQVVGRITQYDTPQAGNNLNACLREQKGLCRHMAMILNDSLNNAGVKSQLMVSPSHLWIRVTLSKSDYGDITFDLDPTWYQQPIPLPPRERSPISPEWVERMLSTVAAPSGGLNLNGMWKTEKGKTVEITHVGNGIVSRVRTSDDIFWIGKISFTGTLAGNNLTGNVLFRAERCPGLDRYAPASGSVSADGNTILLNSTAKYYNPETCTHTGETKPETYNLTRIQLSPSPSPNR